MSIPNYKDIVELLKKGMTIEAQEKIMELREAAMELQEENLKLRERVNQLETDSKTSKSVAFSGKAYWIEGDATPCCQTCYDKDRKLIHLHDGERFVHEPLRLSVLIQAPRVEIEKIISKHEVVRDLVNNGWIHLLQIEPESGNILRRVSCENYAAVSQEMNLAGAMNENTVETPV